MIKHPLINAMAVAGFSAGILISTAANAAYTELGMAAIQSGFPTDMADWLATPADFSWNPANIRLGSHPDRPDGVVYIFANSADAESWWPLVATPTAPMPTGIPDSAVAYMHWALDNNSGLFPGVMAVSDDADFKGRNCIMASGSTIPGGADKTCGNPPASSKRFKMAILKADQPVDLIFNTTTQNLVYDNYTVPEADPTLDIADDIFRNYRYLMKVGNATATDTVGEIRNGTRLTGIKVELGFTDLATDIFTASSDDETDGLAYELTPCIPDRYFDVAPDHQSQKTDICDAGNVEVWVENEFTKFSPSMYASVGDDRNPNGGYWDKNPAGIYPPSLQAANAIDNGTDPGSHGQTGGITDNYFDVGATQAAGAGTPLPANMFGYMMPYGVFGLNDPGLIPPGIYIDDDGDPATEGELYAWWDGSSPTCCYRWGIDRDHNALIGPDEWDLVSDAELAEIKSRPLHETDILDPPRYEIAYMDDLGGLNVDTYIKITPDFDPVVNQTFTVRLTGQSIDTAGVLPGAPGTADGPWVANPAMEFVDLPGAGALQFNPVIYSVEENEGNIVITVERTDGTAGEVTVDYETVDGTAIGGVDFVTGTGTLVFADTVSTQTFQVDLLNDSTVEADKNFTVLLSNASGADVALGTADTATITLTDSDAEAPVDSGSGSSSLSWMTYGLLSLGLLLRRRRL